MGAGIASMNGWYRRMEVDAEPPLSQTNPWYYSKSAAAQAEVREHWHERVKDSPGWYHSVRNDSFIFRQFATSDWDMVDANGLLMYDYDKYVNTTPGFPPRDGWEECEDCIDDSEDQVRPCGPAPILPIRVDADVAPCPE